MLAENNPEAWQALLQMLAEKMVDDAMSQPLAQRPNQDELFTIEAACAH